MKLIPKRALTTSILCVVLLTNCEQISRQNKPPLVTPIEYRTEEQKAIYKSQEVEYARLSFFEKQQIIRTILDSFDWGNIRKEHIYYWELWDDILCPALVKKRPWILSYQEAIFSWNLPKMLIEEYLPIHLKDKKAWDCLFQIMCSSDGDCGWIGDDVKTALDKQVKKTPNIKIIYEKEMQKRDDFVHSLQSSQ